MRHIRNFGDDRQTSFCVHCGGGGIATRDHVPSRVLLDEPYPENLPIVLACQQCNEVASADEEYVACLIECAVVGSASPAAVHRDKIGRILTDRPALAARLANAYTCIGGVTRFEVETHRVRNVILKLARGHALFELNEPHPEEPSRLVFTPLLSMSADSRSAFERLPERVVWPEAGSRGMQRLVESPTCSPEWLVVQPGRYRYMAYVDGRAVVRVVLSEYLACEVAWTEFWEGA